MSAVLSPTAPYRFRSSLRNPFRLFFSPEPWLALIFMLLSFAVGLFWFIVLVTLIAVGIGMSITLVGLPLLAGTLILWTYGARVERFRVNSILGTHIENPYRPLPQGSNWKRFKTRARDPYTWLDLLYLFLIFPIGIAEFAIAVATVSFAGGLVAMPLYYRVADGPVIGSYHINTLPAALAGFVVGFVLVFLIPYVFVGVGRGHAWLARMLLGVSREAELSERVGQLSESRSRAADASVVELQRIERDLHDGAQQRLVKLSMDLGLAREKMATDPAMAESLIAEAHDEAKR
ncbi:MAG TPA: sensor domain-containing protein, partial [Nitrolancea sp.]|nr:sensor domain-containing protein [Nitrolancea sp.]